MEIGDRCPSALDESYRQYAAFVLKTYGFEPAPKNVSIRVYYRGIANHSQGTGIHLLSGIEHQRRKAERAKAAARTLSSLIEA